MYLRSGRMPRAALGDDLDFSLASFPAYVEAWRAELASAGWDFPTNFLLKWIWKESGGNPCSWTSLQEAGIFQLMAGDNIAQGGTSIAQQHPVPPCVAGIQTTAYRSNLTDEQAGWQVNGGLRYVRYCRDKARTMLKSYGYNWSETDPSFWAMVKMWHVAPGVIPSMLQQGIDGYGGPPPDWYAMMTFVTGVPQSWTDNAIDVGLYGAGGAPGITSNKTLVYGMLAAAAVALVVFLKQQRRGVAH